MALTWDLTDIKNYEDVCWEKNDDGTDRLNPVTESLIWLSMGIGMGNITEANANEFYIRVALYEDLFGNMLSTFENGVKKYIPITPEDIISHIGLRTNVGKDSATVFRNRMFKNYAIEKQRLFDREKKEIVNA